MDAVVEALEGQIAPMECFHETPEGQVLCSHEDDGDRACSTKLLWTRVQGGVTKALARHDAGRAGRVLGAARRAARQRSSRRVAPPNSRRPQKRSEIG